MAAWRKFAAQFADPLIYLLFGAVVISFVAWMLEGHDGVPFEVLVILVIVLLNAVLGYVQEARAEQAVAALQRMATASAGVMRDGLEQRVSSDEIVPGDVRGADEIKKVVTRRVVSRPHDHDRARRVLGDMLSG